MVPWLRVTYSVEAQKCLFCELHHEVNLWYQTSQKVFEVIVIVKWQVCYWHTQSSARAIKHSRRLLYAPAHTQHGAGRKHHLNRPSPASFPLKTWMYLFPVEDSLTNSLFVMGTTFWINTCWSSRSPKGPRGKKRKDHLFVCFNPLNFFPKQFWRPRLIWVWLLQF